MLPIQTDLISKCDSELQGRRSSCKDFVAVIGNTEIGWHTVAPIELTQHEIKAVVPRPIPLGENVQCCFGTSNRKFSDRLIGTVHWCRMVKSDWQIGILFKTPLDGRFVKVNTNDQRAALRYEVSLLAFAKRSCDESFSPVTVQEYSVSGCSVMGECHPMQKEQLVLTFDRELNQNLTFEVCFARKLEHGKMIVGLSAIRCDVIDFIAKHQAEEI